MTHIHLTYYERVSVWNLIGNHQVPRLREAAVLLRVLDKVRPTDEEIRETKFSAKGDGNVTWTATSPQYGERDIALEAEEAQALTQVFDGIENVRVNASPPTPLLFPSID